MELSKENNFWPILEADLKIKIPNHIKNNLTLFGFGNALALQDLDDEDITFIEENIRTNILSRLAPYSDQNYSKQQLIDIFGLFYAKTPSEFEFLPGEKKTIKRLAAYTKSKISSESYDYFTNRKISDELNPNDDELQMFPRSQVLLGTFVESAKRNINRKKGGYRYSDEIKAFASFFRMISGPLAYRTLQQNLQAVVPSIQSVNRYIRQTHHRTTECVLRCNELVAYLKDRNLPMAVSLSEDATRIIGRIQYDRKTNQLIGFVPPLSKITGLPKIFSFRAGNFNEIVNHFSSGNTVSSYVNVIMAQPLANTPPFCLLLFGSDNKYTGVDVLNRWKTVTNELQAMNVKVVSISSDSDPKYNSAMRELSGLGNKSELFPAEWFCSSDISNNVPVPMQDAVHMGTKLRNFLLTTSRRIAPFGRHIVDVKHLHILREMFSKDQHGLTRTVLNPLDKQNFSSVLIMCSDDVINLLKTHVKGSEGTVKYLEIMRAIIDSFLNENLQPSNRIQKIWYAVFMLRLWRKFIRLRKGFTLEKNCISMNSYACVEINAHSLVKIMLNLKEAGTSQLFQPHLFSSQPCEETFRQVRSLTTVYSTVVNFSVKEISERINKIQLQSDITNKLSPTFNFPRLKGQTNVNANVELLTKDEIVHEIEVGMQKAIADAFRLGLVNRTTNVDLSCDIQPLNVKERVKSKETVGSTSLTLSFKNLRLKNFSEKFPNQIIDESSAYVEVPSTKSRRMVVKKTSLCWLLRGDHSRLSTDRLERVKAPDNQSLDKECKRKKKKVEKIGNTKKCLMYRAKK